MVFDWNPWNHLTVCKRKWGQARSKMLSTKCVYKSHIFNIYMYKKYLALNNLQWLICHKAQRNSKHRSIWSVDGTLKSTTTPGQNAPTNNVNERLTSLPPELQYGSLTTRYSLMPYLRHAWHCVQWFENYWLV